jgi:hypothetical protein
VPGFLGLPDDAPSHVFRASLARSRIMHSTEGVLKAVSAGIQKCLKRKDNPKYEGLNLLIQAPLHCLPKARWVSIEGDLRLAASKLPFNKIHVIGDQSTEAFGFQIK